MAGGFQREIERRFFLVHVFLFSQEQMKVDGLSPCPMHSRDPLKIPSAEMRMIVAALEKNNNFFSVKNRECHGNTR
jgi:hypothetical protein